MATIQSSTDPRFQPTTSLRERLSGLIAGATSQLPASMQSYPDIPQLGVKKGTLAKDLMTPAENLPVVGQALSAEDLSQAAHNKDWWGMGLAALGMMPGGGVEKNAAEEVARLGRKELAEIKSGIKAYHGSPHSFDQFDISKIGTGEGAQAYGHGLYFAENEGVARQYRDNLARPDFNVTRSGTPISSDLSRILEDSYDDATRQGVSAPSHRDAIHLAQQNLDRQRQDALKAQDFEWFNKVSDQITELQRMGKDAPATKGSMYEVNINADPAHFLDWDKPLSEQSGHVSEALNQVVKSRDRMPSEWLGSSPGAERNMSEAGIPGIKYLDAGSRGAAEGSRNYVVFDDKLISIVKKNGIAAALAAGLITESQAQEMRDQGYED